MALGAFEVASRLSYFIWGSLPDDDFSTRRPRVNCLPMRRSNASPPTPRRSQGAPHIAAFFSEFSS